MSPVTVGLGMAFLCAAQSLPPISATVPADVASPPARAQRTASGLATTVLTPGDGNDHPVDNDCVKIVFRAWRRDGSLFSASGEEAVTQCLRPAMSGIAEALKLMSAGEERLIWLPANLTAAAMAHHADKNLIDTVAANVDLTFDLRLVRILHAPPMPSPLTPPADDVVKFKSGAVMQILKRETSTEHPSATSWLKLAYTGWTRNGELFESTEIAGAPVLVPFGMTPPAWQESLLTMVPGEKVRLWIPASLGYGGRPDSRLLPAGDLIYDIEILGIN
jgi:FKBP-type peptidyl-prolyl cis-trans isomerase